MQNSIRNASVSHQLAQEDPEEYLPHPSSSNKLSNFWQWACNWETNKKTGSVKHWGRPLQHKQIDTEVSPHHHSRLKFQRGPSFTTICPKSFNTM